MSRQIRNRRSLARQSAQAARRPRFSVMELLEGRLLMSTYTVTTNADGGAGSLRQAILDSNTNPGADLIQFNLPAGGTTIQPTSALPAVQDTLTIDGTSQPGYAGTPVVELDGELAGSSTVVSGLVLSAPGAVVRGLVINRFSGDGIAVIGGNATIQGNYIGTDLAGAVAMPNANGIEVTSTGNLIGGAAAGQGNLISGNMHEGIVFHDIAPADPTAITNVVEGNVIGLDATGTFAPANQSQSIGIDIGTRGDLSASGILIGGTDPGARNVISGNTGSGVLIAASSYVTIQGNLIGTDSNGTAVSDIGFADNTGNFGNGVQIQDGSHDILIGGTTPAARNVISANSGNGVNISEPAPVANPPSPQQVPTSVVTISGNYIGTDATGMIGNGTTGNQGDGIFAGVPVVIKGNLISGNAFGAGIDLTGGSLVQGNLIGTDALGSPTLGNSTGVEVGLDPSAANSNDTIGGTGAGEGNVIAGNSFVGVNLTAGTGNVVRGNSIFSNAMLGIDLNGDGVTLNDTFGHVGPNNYQDFPVLSAATGTTAKVTFTGTLGGGTPGASYTLDFYANAAADASGHGQGQTYLGSAVVTAGADGTVAFSVALDVSVPAGQMIFSATATDAAGNTSEFSQDVLGTLSAPAASMTMLTSSEPASVFGDSVTFTATVSGTTPAVPTGNVEFEDGTTVLGSVALDATGRALFTTNLLSPGLLPHSISAVYVGDATYPGSSATIAQTVNRAGSTTTLAESATTATFGDAVTFTATVTGGTNLAMPSDVVTFFDGTIELGSATLDSNGVATLTTSALAIGSHSVTATYGGDDNFCASQSDPVSLTVNPAGSTIGGKTLSDYTGNGLSDDDSPLGGVTVKLFMDLNGNGVLDSGDGGPVTTVVSDSATGVYAFSNLTPATYFVQESTPTGYVQTAPVNGTYYTINITAGSQSGETDFDNYHECNHCGTDLAGVYYMINGRKKVTNLRGQVHQGDLVQAFFTVTAGHTDTLSLVSYTAPGPTFVASQAGQQQIYDLASGTFSTGHYSLTVHVPRCYFQVDFVCGLAIDHFGSAGSNIFYSAEGRLISADNGGTTPPPAG